MQAFHIKLCNVKTAIITILADGDSPLQPEHYACKGVLSAETADSKIVQGLISRIGTGRCRVSGVAFIFASGGDCKPLQALPPVADPFQFAFQQKGPSQKFNPAQ